LITLLALNTSSYPNKVYRVSHTYLLYSCSTFFDHSSNTLNSALLPLFSASLYAPFKISPVLQSLRIRNNDLLYIKTILLLNI
jgi:hypothetical protein